MLSVKAKASIIAAATVATLVVTGSGQALSDDRYHYHNEETGETIPLNDAYKYNEVTGEWYYDGLVNGDGSPYDETKHMKVPFCCVPVEEGEVGHVGGMAREEWETITNDRTHGLPSDAPDEPDHQDDEVRVRR